MKTGYRIMVAVIAVFAVITVGLGADQKPSKKGWLGVTIQDVIEKIQKKNKLKSDEGAYVVEVADDSPADSAGIRDGDVILSFAGKTIMDTEDLSRAVAKTQPGTKVEIAFVRDGSQKSVSVMIGRQKRAVSFFGYAAPSLPHIEVFRSPGMLGVTARTLNEQLAEYFGAPNNEGVLVEEVTKDGAAAKAGIKAGDVIIRVGKRTIDEVGDISKELRKADEGDKVEVEVLRKGTRKTFSVEVEESDTPFHWRGELPRVRVMPRIRHDSFRRESDDAREDVEREFQRMLESQHNSLKDLKVEIERTMPKVQSLIRSSITL